MAWKQGSGDRHDYTQPSPVQFLCAVVTGKARKLPGTLDIGAVFPETLVGCMGASTSQSESLHLRVTVLHKSLMAKLGEKIIRALVSSLASCQVAYETMRAYV